MNRQNLTIPIWARVCGVAMLAVAFASPAAATQFQTPATNVTTSDIQRLQDQVYQAGPDVSRARGDMAAQLQTELDDLRDEVVYLKVKMRKEGSLNRNEYTDVRDRLQDLRSRARGESTWRPGTMTNGGTGTGTYGGVNGGVIGGTSGSGTGGSPGRINGRVLGSERQQTTPSTRASASAIPAGTELDVRLQHELSSATAQVEQRFEATTEVDLFRGNDVLVPAGSVLRGVVSSVDKATRTARKGSLTVSFDQITIHGRDYPIRGTVTQAIESAGIKGEAAKIGTGGAVGAIIGGILGGVKGAVLGVLIGGGGTIAATEGTDVKLPSGTILRVKLDTPPNVK